MGALKPWHIIIIVVAFMLLFGFKKLPDAARSIGRSMRIFKSEVDEMKAESQAAKSESDASKATVEGQKVDDVIDPVTPPAGENVEAPRTDRTA
ncbi:MAG TPA: Sec-independent protein translocase subunit TatA [Phycicoccus sp.]|nr:Sec-independent protein translocase subunit TatA [Phycicoccus sp.]